MFFFFKRDINGYKVHFKYIKNVYEWFLHYYQSGV
jgi:hypothetical protein